MPRTDELQDVPKCPVCGELMIRPEGEYLCLSALAESFVDDLGHWQRMEWSRHPVRPEEIDYLDAHGVYRAFI